MNILLKPNAGIPVLKDGNAFYNESPSFFSDRAPELLSLGNALIGGCCGTTPDHIRALRNTIDRYRIN
jgi:5-methyltetrahydrofolate--homocysteine methyltransferase